MLASFGGFIGWVALSAAWSTSTERSILEAQRGLVYLAALLMVFLVARGRSIVELLAAVCATAMLISAFALVNLSNPSANAYLGDGQGLATIVDDD